MQFKLAVRQVAPFSPSGLSLTQELQVNKIMKKVADTGEGQQCNNTVLPDSYMCSRSHRLSVADGCHCRGYRPGNVSWISEVSLFQNAGRVQGGWKGGECSVLSFSQRDIAGSTHVPTPLRHLPRSILLRCCLHHCVCASLLMPAAFSLASGSGRMASWPF